MSRSKSLENLVKEAIYLRDHLIHVEGQDSVQLDLALQPLDNADGLDNASDNEVSALRAAFQKAHDSALKSVDGYTLAEVLIGRAPREYRPSVFGSATLVAIGVVLVSAALYFTLWSSRTTFILSKAEEFIEFDQHPSVMKLVELENYFNQKRDESLNPDLELQLVYLERVSVLRDHYTDQTLLPAGMKRQLDDVMFLHGIRDSAKRSFCNFRNEQEHIAQNWLMAWLISCPTKLSGPSRGPTAVPTGSNVNLGLTKTELSEIQKRQAETMRMIVEHQTPIGYAYSRIAVDGMIQSLKEYLNVVHHWTLPIIYGALGSIVYCMWRVLNPNVAPLRFLYAVMRTAFAGLAALTLSMLLVPSNVLSAGIEVNRPVVYLLSFIFGYSIEAFVSTLNLLNTYLSTNLTPKPRRTG